MQKKTRKKVTTVREHLRHTPISQKNPAGLTIVDQHPRHLPGTYLDADGITLLAKNYDRRHIVFPTAGKLKKYKNADKYDDLIAIWTDYFNKKVGAEALLDPDVVKALIASESSFREDPPNPIAIGITQITKETLKILQDPKGEAKDFLFNKIRQKDLKNPIIAIPRAIRWLFLKKATVLNVALASAVIVIIGVWMMKATIIKKSDYQKSHALNDLIDSDKAGDAQNITPQQAVGTSVTSRDFADDGKATAKNIGELDRSALVIAPATKPDSGSQTPAPTWNVVLEQPGVLVINGREYGVVKTKNVNLAFGVHVFEVRRNGKPTSQFTIALSNDTPKKISVK